MTLGRFRCDRQHFKRTTAIVLRVGDHGIGPPRVHFVVAAGEVGKDLARRFGATGGFLDATMPGEDLGSDAHVMILRCAPGRDRRVGQHALGQFQRSRMLAEAANASARLERANSTSCPLL